MYHATGTRTMNTYLKLYANILVSKCLEQISKSDARAQSPMEAFNKEKA